MISRTIFLMAMWVVCGVSVTLAQDCFDYSPPTHFVNRLSVPSPGVGTQGTDLRAIDIAWPYAYAGGNPLFFDKPYFYVVDISDQTNPEVLGWIADAFDGIWDLEVHGDLVYGVGNQLGGSTGDLSVIDVSDPVNPVLAGGTPLPGWGLSISVAEGQGLAFAACGESGLVAVDVSAPGAPVVIGSLTFGANDTAWNVVVDFPHAYVATEALVGFVVVDVSDPADMQAVGSLPILVKDVAMVGEDVCAVSSEGLHLVDISDPMLPAIVGTLGDWNLSSVEVAGSIAFSRGGSTPLLFDIADPTNPVFQASPNMQSASPATRPIAVHNGYIYTAAGGQTNINGFGIEVGMLGDDEGLFPAAVGSLTDHLVYAMRFHGNLGYFVGDKLVDSDYQPSLSLYDIADPSSPLLLGRVDYGTAGQRSSVDGNGTHAFVTGLTDLTAYDISDPAAMVPVGTIPLDYFGVSSWLDGSHLYLTDGTYPDRGLRVFDVSDPAAMVEVGFVEIDSESEGINDVVVRGDFAFVTRAINENYGSSGLDVVDISDPTLPFIVATIDTPAPAQALSIEGDLAWVSYGNTIGEHALRLAVIDISDPLSPVMVNDIGAPYTTTDIGIIGDSLYLTTRFKGPAVVDISNPLKAHGLGILDPDFSYGFQLEVGNGHVFATSWLGSGSVRIYAPQCDPVSAVMDDPPAVPQFVMEAHPNPFNPVVNLSFALSVAQHVNLEIFDLAGRKIATVFRGRMSAGPKSVQWRGQDDSGHGVAAGVYFAKVSTHGGSDLKKLTLLK